MIIITIRPIPNFMFGRVHQMAAPVGGESLLSLYAFSNLFVIIPHNRTKFQPNVFLQVFLLNTEILRFSNI